jgi:K+-transporting ATPase ATPase A chain
LKTTDVIQVLVFISILVGLTPPLGAYMTRILNGERTFLSPILGRLERLCYKFAGINPHQEMTAAKYSFAVIALSAISVIAVFAIQLTQGFLPLNPQNLPMVPWHSAINTAISFMTNTNWQSYSGETTLSYFTQMVALTVQNFLSAAVGFAVFVALVRGITRHSSATIGNFWADITRSTIYILLPLSLVFALILVSQGVVQCFSGYSEVTTLEGLKQSIPRGPAASQIAIKQLGTNGGGFFNANSAHPFENPTPLTNFLEMLAILLIPAALTYTYGKMVGSTRQGWTLFIVMISVWLASLVGSIASEYSTNPVFKKSALMEGKETRIGVVNSLIWSTATTVASNGSVNAMHSSLSPLAGGIAMFNIMLGEVIFGGVGAGMYGMLLFVLLTVFLAGLMVGRSPEYLEKKIEAREMQMAIVGILLPCAVILIGTAVSCVLPNALTSLSSKGPHGFSEILYAMTSAAGNNGSAFAGLNANTVYFNLVLSLLMLIGRFAVILPVLAIAGSLAAKRAVPANAGTFSTDTPVFGILLFGVILIVGALTFLPAFSLGPIAEHFLMINGRTF